MAAVLVKRSIADSREARVVRPALGVYILSHAQQRADRAWLMRLANSAGPYFYVYICCSQFFISVNFVFSLYKIHQYTLPCPETIKKIIKINYNKSLGVRNVITSSSEKLDRRCFDCFCHRFCYQEMLFGHYFRWQKYFTEKNEAIWTSTCNI